MDETIVTYPDMPLERLRSRIQIAGCLPDQLADVLDVDPCELPSPQFGLVTRNIPCGVQNVAVGPTGDTIAAFGEITGGETGGLPAIGPEPAEHTVVSHVVSVGKTFHLIGFIGTGNLQCTFTTYISPAATFLSGERILVGRNSVAQPTIQESTQLATPTGSAGDTIAVRVSHCTPEIPSGAVLEFQVTLLGYEV
ncbi:MAG: hypothetical protein ACW99G_06895 [Candidatus Thorarchaeota archaeon]